MDIQQDPRKFIHSWTNNLRPVRRPQHIIKEGYKKTGQFKYRNQIEFIPKFWQDQISWATKQNKIQDSGQTLMYHINLEEIKFP